MITPKFLAPSTSFHAELRRRTDAYFKERGTSATGNYKLFTKAGILVGSLLFLYVHLVFFTPQVLWAVLECVLLGIVTAAIGFNIMHDGAHGSFSKRKWLNQLAGLSLNILGANVFMWKTKHNVIHHSYTNIDGVDDDLDARPFLRLCQSQKRYKIHRYQHFYFWLTYMGLYLYWIFCSDFVKYFTQKVGDMPLTKMEKKDHVSFWGFKVFYLSMFAALPIYTVGLLPWLTGFLLYTMCTGFTMSIVFQLAHTVEDTNFPLPCATTHKIEDEWAIHQLKTTANFATNNKLVTWFMGGLNFQIEHHLFPKISHIHYPEISRIIKQTCQDFNIPYLEFPKTRMAVASHVAHLRQLALH